MNNKIDNKMSNALKLPIITVNKIDQWLDKKVNDETILSKHEIDKYTIKPYQSHYDKDAYYVKNDPDIKSSDQIVHQLINDFGQNFIIEDPKLQNLVMYDDHILLNPNTNRYHANLLFRKLVDFSFDNDYDYTIYNANDDEQINVNLMDVSLKKSFYKFCHDNS